jgi:hypothetical protein
MFKVFYLEDPNLPDDHDLILDGYNMEVYQYFLPLNPYPDTVQACGMEFTGARINLNHHSFLQFLKFIRQYPHEFHVIIYHHQIQTIYAIN